MKIEKVTCDKGRFMPLLLLGDEQESMVLRYLGKGELFAMWHDTGELVAVAVVTDEGDGVAELKNLAVAAHFQRRGYGRSMVEHVCSRYGNTYKTLIVGTGDSVATTAFYASCGFVYSHRVANFFVDNYDHPIIEEGKQLRDMLYFKRALVPNHD